LNRATTSLVLFLNPDAVIASGDLAALVAYLDAHPNVALVAPRVFRNGEPLTSAGRASTLASSIGFLLPPWIGRHLPDNRLPAEHDVTGPVDYVEGACMLARREALARVGAFDERYFLFFEEQDLSRRLRSAGYETHLDAGSRVEHAVGAARASVAFGARPHYVASNRSYLRRWHGRLSAAVFSGVVATSWWARGRLGRVDRDHAAAIVSAARGRY
jgi:GT2 family glycosyltransferase